MSLITPVSLLACMIDTSTVVLAQGVRHRPGVDAAVRPRRQVGHRHTGTLQPATGVEHRLVFAGGSDHMATAALLDHALDGQVVGLGGAAGPDDFTGVRVKRVGHLAAGVFHRLFRQPAVQDGCVMPDWRTCPSGPRWRIITSTTRGSTGVVAA